MVINVKRIYKGAGYTVGRLFLDGTYLCDTLEDRDRGLSSDMSAEEIAKIRQMPLDELTGITTENAERFFKI